MAGAKSHSTSSSSRSSSTKSVSTSTSSRSNPNSTSSKKDDIGVEVGDMVQIKAGGMDVTNGKKATKGKMYGQGGPLWAKVVLIDKHWKTGKKFGLPAEVIKVRCSNSGVVVWQVRPEDIILKTKKKKKDESKKKEKKKKKKKKKTAKKVTKDRPAPKERSAVGSSNNPYGPQSESNTWAKGQVSTMRTDEPESTFVHAPYISGSVYDEDAGAIYGEWRGMNTKIKNIVKSTDQGRVPSSIKKGVSALIANHNKDEVWWYDQAEYLKADNKYVRKNNKRKANGKDPIYRFQVSTDNEGNHIKGNTEIHKTVGAYNEVVYPTSMDIDTRKKELFDIDTKYIQNQYGYPGVDARYPTWAEDHMTSPGSSASKKTIEKQAEEIRLHGMNQKYNYQFIPGDSKYNKGPAYNIEERLKLFRASVGLPIHGSSKIARSMKFYMYNRFKVPDTNLAHNRSFTYVFFTRPDLYLLGDGKYKNKANEQCMNHSETAMLWRRRPEIFKLLTDKSRCNDTNNFNLLLSNQITSFGISDEELATLRAGRSWNEHEITYGDSYTGRGSGDFTCTFMDTSEYSVISMIKLWMTYIDNVSSGAWSPNYKKGHCHVHDRAIDYGASVYVFKCGPDGEDVLYWSKYYGVFPVITGASALSWDLSNPIGDTPKLSIRFAYSYKRDLSPISLLEFNHLGGVKKTDKEVKWQPGFNLKYAHTDRAFTGIPYIEMNLASPILGSNDVNKALKETQIRLKFRKGVHKNRSDDILYKFKKVPNDGAYTGNQSRESDAGFKSN